MIGLVHAKRRIIYVTRLLAAPHDSQGGPLRFVRGIHDLPEGVTDIERRTGGPLGYVGEWHTHPKGGPDLSPTDIVAAARLKRDLDRIPMPTQIMVVTPRGIYSHIFEAESDQMLVRGRKVIFFRLAIKRGQYSKNPVDSVERAVQPARELKPEEATVGLDTDAIDPDSVLNPQEIQTLLQEATSGFERKLFETAYLTGAREGELLALRWTDLELPKDGAGRMAIRRSLSWARAQGEEIRPRYFLPKTKAGRRTISIPALLVAELKR